MNEPRQLLCPRTASYMLCAVCGGILIGNWFGIFARIRIFCFCCVTQFEINDQTSAVEQRPLAGDKTCMIRAR